VRAAAEHARAAKSFILSNFRTSCIIYLNDIFHTSLFCESVDDDLLTGSQLWLSNSFGKCWLLLLMLRLLNRI
jgi:hypothetical protein